MPLTFAGDAVRNTWTLCVAGGVLTLMRSAVCGCAHASAGTWEWGCVAVLAAVIGRLCVDVWAWRSLAGHILRPKGKVGCRRVTSR